MNNKQVLVYGMLETTNDLRSIFVGHILFKKLMKFRKFIEIFHCCLNRLRNKKWFLLFILLNKNLIMENIGQRSFKKHLKFHDFVEIYYYGMTRLSNTNLSVFIQCQYTRTILRNKYMGQSQFKKHSKFWKFDEILYCGMTRFKNVKLGVFRQYQSTKTIFKKKNSKNFS